MRDNKWLKERLIQIWQRYFADVQIKNEVMVRFGQPAKTRLGSIKFGRSTSSRQAADRTYITVTGYFRDPQIPEFMVDSVLAHELTHYAHGFYSPHSRLFHQPHQHGVVNQELTQRGLHDILMMQKRWLKDHWPKYLKHHPPRQ